MHAREFHLWRLRGSSQSVDFPQQQRGKSTVQRRRELRFERSSNENEPAALKLPIKYDIPNSRTWEFGSVRYLRNIYRTS